MNDAVHGQNRGWRRWLPGVAVLRGYDKAWLRGDVLAGVTVSAYLVPQVMAYAAVAGLPPNVGLIACIGPFLVYALVGSSRQLSVGPESTTALMTAAAVGGLVGTVGQGRYGELAALLALTVGVICVVARFARLGFLSEFLSRPVLIGYMAGVAVLMMISQLGRVLGISVSGDRTDQELVSVWRQLGSIHVATVTVAGTVLFALMLMRRFAPKWPGPLIVIAAAAVVVWWADGQRWGLKLVGPLPPGVPMPRLPDPTGVPVVELLLAAVGIVLVGYSDNVLTGRAFASKRREPLDADQEFLALGLVNVAASVTQGFPVSSSGSRTALGDSMGSRTQLYSLVAVICIVATLLFLGPALAQFPMAALGAVVVYAALRLIDLSEWKRLARFRTSELILAAATAVTVIFVGVLPGIGIAIGLSILDLLRRLASPHDAILGYVPQLAGMHDVDDYKTAEQVPGILVYRYDSPLFFANAEDFVDRALASVDQSAGPVSWFLLNAEANTEVDLTAIDALDSLRELLLARGITFAMARVKQDLRDQLRVAGFLDKVGEDRVFPTLPSGMWAFADWYEEQTGTRVTLPVPRPSSNGGSTGPS